MAERFGANVVDLKKEAGKTFGYDELKEAIETHKPAVLFLCQGESSTGVHQNLAGLGALCQANGTLLLVDTVCSLGGVPLFADEWGIDCIYSGSQKCLSAPPGAAPLMMSERAMAKIKGRKTKVGGARARTTRAGAPPMGGGGGAPPSTRADPAQVRSYYLDLNLVGDYWGWYGSRSYHHTGMVRLRCGGVMGAQRGRCKRSGGGGRARPLALPLAGEHVVRDARGAGDRRGGGPRVDVGAPRGCAQADVGGPEVRGGGVGRGGRPGARARVRQPSPGTALLTCALSPPLPRAHTRCTQRHGPGAVCGGRQ